MTQCLLAQQMHVVYNLYLDDSYTIVEAKNVSYRAPKPCCMIMC